VGDLVDEQPDLPAEDPAPEANLVGLVTIKRHVRDMEPAHETGGTGAKILGDTQGRQWLVKAPNNPQGKRILANEYVAAALGARIGALMQLGSVCMVGEDVAVTMTLPSGASWAPGEAFGSAFADGTKPYLDTMAPEIRNRDQLLGAISLDTWLSQHDSRQARVRDAIGGGYDVIPVDFGHCIGPANWLDLAARPPIISVHDPNRWSIGVSAVAVAAVAEAISGVSDGELQHAADSVPTSWGVTEAERVALVAFLVGRREAVVAALRALAPAVP
jgi:hypothetical protein